MGKQHGQDQGVEEFDRQGFVGPLDILSLDDAHEALEAVMKELNRSGQDDNMRFKLHLIIPCISRIVHNSMLVQAVQAALKTNDVVLWSSDVNIKAKRSSGFFAKHQDSTYAGLYPPHQVLTAWIALSDPVGEAEGCLSFYKGSHHLGQLEHGDRRSKRLSGNEFSNSLPSNKDNMLSLGQYIENAGPLRNFERVSIPLRAGQATLHNFLTVHESGPNNSDQDRVGLALRFMASTVRQIKPIREMVTVVSGAPPLHFDLEPRLADAATGEGIEQGRRAHREAMKRESANYFMDYIEDST